MPGWIGGWGTKPKASDQSDLPSASINAAIKEASDEHQRENIFENTPLFLGHLTEALKAQVEGVRQMLTRIGALLTLCVTLVSGDLAFISWLVSQKPPSTRLMVAAGATGVTLVCAGTVCLVGMQSIRLAAPGIALDDLNLSALGQESKKATTWVLGTIADAIHEGNKPARKVMQLLDWAALMVGVSPLVGVVIYLVEWALGLLV